MFSWHTAIVRTGGLSCMFSRSSVGIGCLINYCLSKSTAVLKIRDIFRSQGESPDGLDELILHRHGSSVFLYVWTCSMTTKNRLRRPPRFKPGHGQQGRRYRRGGRCHWAAASISQVCVTSSPVCHAHGVTTASRGPGLLFCATLMQTSKCRCDL